MNFRLMSFYLGFGLQLVGITITGLCLFAGIQTGDYSKLGLAQFIGGICAFYFGTLLRNKSS